MYILRCSLTGEQVSPWFWTEDDALMARGHSELLEVEEDNAVLIPRDLDMSLGAQAQRRGKAFDPYGMFWAKFWREAKLDGSRDEEP